MIDVSVEYVRPVFGTYLLPLYSPINKFVSFLLLT